MQRAVGTARPWTVACGVPAAGVATFIVKPSRRQELGVYCASRAVEAAALCAVSWGWVPATREGMAGRRRAFRSLAAASIMHCYNAERDVFRSKYLNVLDFVFGNQGHGEAERASRRERVSAHVDALADGARRRRRRGGEGRRASRTRGTRRYESSSDEKDDETRKGR